MGTDAKEVLGKATGEGDPRRVKVLVYHRVVDDIRLAERFPGCVHTSVFCRQLELLDQWGCTPITFSDFRLFRDGELHLPRRPFILTLDGGYQDIYRVAFPLLRERGMAAVAFVIADPVMTVSVWDARAMMPAAPLVTAEQIQEMHAAGFEIGSHGLSNRDLLTLPPAVAWEEIVRSKEHLEVLLHSPVISFAYPRGQVGYRIKQLVASAGYEFACARSSGPPTFGDDMYEIRRLCMQNTLGTLGLRVRLLATFQHVDRLLETSRQVYRPANGQTRRNGRP